jgi:hypothetical protein
MADALPRERWTLAAGILFVVLGGIFPNQAGRGFSPAAGLLSGAHLADYPAGYRR